MASSSSGPSSHLGATDNQKRWLVVGIALNKIFVPHIRPFVEQEVAKEYNNLKKSHNIHAQSTSGRLQRWPPRKFLKYENINGNGLHPKLPGGKNNFSLFDCRVSSHIDFAKLYIENFMAKFNAFDDHCDASAVLTLLAGMPVFSAVVQAAASDVRSSVRNDWAHCVFSRWDPVKFQQSFGEMEHLVRVMALPPADEANLLAELKDWETKGTQLCINSPVDPALLQLIQKEINFLQDIVNNLSVEFDHEKLKLQQELQNSAIILEEMKQTVKNLKEDVDQRLGKVEDQVHSLQEKIHYSSAQESAVSSASLKYPLTSSVTPGTFVELIRRDYKGAVLCPFPWCEDELQLELSNIFTKLQIVVRTKERSKLTDETVHMSDVFKPHKECDNPRVVLIEGNPGMGKTTYCQKLAYDWSVGEIPPEGSFPEVEILLLLKCRDMHMKTSNIEEAIEDQLLPQDAGQKEKEDFFLFIRSNQSRILLVLDGLDELREDLVRGFLPLIQGKVFANVYLMLTARHEAGTKVRRYCDTLLEIVGYTQDDAKRYISKYFSSHEDQSLAGKMIKQFDRDEHLRELMVNPMNTALLCLLCEETGGMLPSKRTKLYDGLVSCALRRYLAKRSIYLADEDPVEQYANELNQLGKMAFDALLKNLLYFSHDEMKCQSTVDFLRLPFLSREPSLSKVRPIPCYAFTHKTFQEYFAAFYLAHQVLSGDKKKEKLLDTLSPIDNWQVWEFLITLVLSKRAETAVTVVSRLCAFFYQERPQRLTDKDEDSDVTIFDKKPYDWIKSLKKFSTKEASLKEVLDKTLDFIAKCGDYENELTDYQKKMIRVLAHCFPAKKLKLFFFPGNCPHLVYREYLQSNYSLTGLFLTSELNQSLLATIDKVFHSKPKLVHFKFKTPEFLSYNDQETSWIQSFGAKALLKEVLQAGRVLTHLNFYNIPFSSRETKAIAEFLHTNRTLSHLNLGCTRVFDEGAIALGNVLQSNCTLTHLSLPRNYIGGLGAEALAAGLQRNSVLVYLDLSGNMSVEDSLSVALSKAVESNCSLKFLDLGNWSIMMFKFHGQFTPALKYTHYLKQIGPTGASTLARALRFNCTLTYLNLQFNKISDLGAAALGESLQTNSTLTELNLECNEIGRTGAVALAEALQSNRTLTFLNLNYNPSIGDSGAAAIAKVLQSNEGRLAQFINLSGTTSVAEAHHTGSCLTHLGLRRSGISSSGSSAIAKALQSNRLLIHLDLSGNDIGDLGATELANTLQNHNKTLRYLDLRQDNLMGSVGRETLKQVDQSKCVVRCKGCLMHIAEFLVTLNAIL